MCDDDADDLASVGGVTTSARCDHVPLVPVTRCLAPDTPVTCCNKEFSGGLMGGVSGSSGVQPG